MFVFSWLILNIFRTLDFRNGGFGRELEFYKVCCPIKSTMHVKSRQEVYNVDETLTQILRTNTKMDGMINRLKDVEDPSGKLKLFLI